MSYILDALKKAESERNLGAVPNVYANAPHATQTNDGANWGKILPWSLTAIALGIVLIGLAWLQPWHTQPAVMAATPVVTPAPQPAPVTEPMVPTEPVATSTPPQTSSTIPVATVAAPIKTEDKPAQVKPAPAPAAAASPTKPAPQPVEKKIADAAPVKEEKQIAKAETTPEPKLETKAEAKTEVKTETKADGSDVGTARDLPQAIQSQLPAISVNGYLYDKDPADRSVLMNQKLLREGDTVAPDLVLEKLLPKGAVLNYKGYRYRIAF